MKAIDYIFGGLIGLAIVLVLVKPQAQTAQVINAGGSQINDIFGTLTRVSG